MVNITVSRKKIVGQFESIQTNYGQQIRLRY